MDIQWPYLANGLIILEETILFHLPIQSYMYSLPIYSLIYYDK